MGRPSLIALCVAMASCGQGAGPKPETGSAKPTWATLDLLAGVPGGHGWVDGALAVAHFDSPWAIASDGGNRLFVADGDTIRVVDRAGGSVTTLAGAYGQVGASDGIGVEARFNSPSGLAFADGQLYLTDTEDHTLRKIDVQTGMVTTLAGAPRQPGSLDGQGTDARFQEPEGLALDANGHLYIGDTDNNAIRMFVIATGAVTTIAGTPGMSGSADGVGAQARFSKPTALALDGSGNLYVIDGLNESVRKLELATGAVSTVAKFAALPQGVATDGNDVIVSLSDLPSGNHSITRLSAGGAVTLLAGSAMGQGFVDALGGDARFNSPAGLLNDGAGTLYVADSGNWVLRKVALATGAVATYAGALSVGSNDGAGPSARFSAPQGLATDGQFAYVADTGNDTIRKVALATGEVTSLAGATGQSGQVDGALADARLNQPQGIALDGTAGALYVADTLNRKIRQIDLSAGKVSTLTYSAAPGAAAVDLDAPSGLALDHGLLFVTDSTDDVVVQIDLKKAQISALAGQYRVPGEVDGVGTNAGFYRPVGIAADGQGHLYVADSEGETLRKIDIASAAVSTIAGIPTIRGSNDGARGVAHFAYPTGVAVDAEGNVFVSDFQNNTVRRVVLSTGAVTTAVGTATGAGVRLGPLPGQLTLPSALAITPSGALLLVSENSILIAH